MNKTVTINLSGIVFNIDENAFEILKKYLDNLKLHFAGTQGRDEIIADIESRFAEMFAAKVGPAKNVITLEDVNEVIGVMGKPEEVAAAGSDDAPKDSPKSDSSSFYYENMKKRFFRNPDDKVLGGVCSGISAYFDIDPIWLRLAFGLSIIFAGTGILLYIILWVIVPEAKTAADKLQMRGERVTVQNIQKSVQEEFENLKKRGETFAGSIASDENKTRVRSAGQKFGDFIGDIFRALGKFIAVVFGIIITIISISVLIGLTVAIFSGIGVFHFVIPSAITHMVITESQLWWLIIGGLLSVGIPFTLLLLNGLKILFKVKLNLKAIGAIMAGFWLIGLGICIMTGIQIGSEFKEEASPLPARKLVETENKTIYLKAQHHWSTDNDDYFSRDGVQFGNLKFLDSKNDTIICRAVSVNVEASTNDSVYVIQKVESHGSTYGEAKDLAASISYAYAVSDSQIVLPNYFTLDRNDKYRGQNVQLTLLLPAGRSVVFDKSLGWMLRNVDNTADIYDWDMLGHEFKMMKEGLTCLDCPPDSTDREHHHHIHIGHGDIDIQD